MNTNNFTASQKGDGSSFTENSTKYAADSSYDGLSQDEMRRLQEMAPELRGALLRLRRNIHSRQQEREQEAETRELNKLLGVKTPLDAAEERNARNLQAAMAEQARLDREAIKKKFLCQRHANGRALIITTNLSPAGLAKLYPGRIMERLRERCLVLEHNCASLRGKNVFSVIA